MPPQEGTPRPQAPAERPAPGPAGEEAEIDAETAEAVMAEMAEVRRQLAQVPAAVVVANHAMGLYELGAIHLSQDPPNLPEARLAIDAFSRLVEGLEGRLGEAEPTLRDALSQIQLAFVQISQQATGAGSPGEGGA